MGVSHREPIRRAVEVVKEADRRGIDCLWLIDSQLIMKDVHVVLALCAAETDRIRLATGVTNPLTRHLTVTAGAACALQEVSGGRFILGLGAGDSAVYPLGLRPASVRRCEESLRTLRTLFQGEEISEGNSAFRLKTARAAPLFFATSQPRMLRLAGRAADGANILGIAAPEIVNQQIEHVRRGASEAGRKPADVFIDLWLTLSVDADSGAALDGARSWASTKARWLATWESPPSTPTGRTSRGRPRGMTSPSTSPSARLISRRSATISRRPSPSREPRSTSPRGFRSSCKLDVDRITLTLLSGGRMEHLRLLCEEVLPRVNHSGAETPAPRSD